MRRLSLALSIPATLLTVLSVAPRADAASIQYSTIKLGGNYAFQTDASGSVTGLTASDLGVTYAFSKTPVTAINEVTVNGDGRHYALDQTLTMQDGAYKVGYNTNTNFDDDKSHNAVGAYVYPTFEPHDTNWFTGGPPRFPVISDLNVQGQVIGQGWILGTNPNPFTSYFAAFSAVGAQPHGGDASITDNLNNYIASIPGVSLTSAVAIDDLGRILAVGSDANAYLLTPLSLGGVATVPEPTTLVVIAVGGVLWMARSLRRSTQKDMKIKRSA